MSFISAVLLGILQGLTEFLPVSSSGHLVLAQHFFGIKDSGDTLFEVFMHLGTLLAVLVFFRRRIWNLLVSLFSWKQTLRHQDHLRNRNVILYLLTASLATGLVYLLFGDLFENLYSQPLIVAVMLLVTGLVVFVSDKLHSGDILASNMGLPRSLLVGLIQGIWAACRSDQYASDALIDGRYGGAFTTYLCNLVRQGDGRLSRAELAKVLRSELKKAEFKQTPQLEGSTKPRKAPFLTT